MGSVNIYVNPEHITTFYAERNEGTAINFIKGTVWVNETPAKIIKLINETMWPVHE